MIQDNNYYIVHGWMINELQLKGNELITYAIIYGFSQDNESEFNGSLKYLQSMNGGVAKSTIIRTLNSLVEKGYITKSELVSNGVKFCKYRANAPTGSEMKPVVSKCYQGGFKMKPGGSSKMIPNKEDIYKEVYKEDIKENKKEKFVKPTIQELKEITGMKQTDKLKYWFDRFNTITRIEAFDELAIFELCSNINHLIQDGYVFERKTEKGLNRFGEKCKYTTYTLIKKGE